MLLRTISLGRPGEAISFWADPAHLAEVRKMLGDAPATTYNPLRIWSHLPEKIEFSSYRRFWHGLRTLFGIHYRYRHQKPVMVVASGSPSGILAAYALHRVRGSFTQIICHGELTTIENGWVPRNPFYRFLRHEPVMRLCHGPEFRYVVLEQPIKERLQWLIPKVAATIDVLPHPVNEREITASAPPPVRPPIRVGSLGVATYAKGFDIWARLVATLSETASLEFYHIGRLHPDFLGQQLKGFANSPGPEDLPRSDFIARVQELHYVCLPLPGRYYELAASATLIDAMTCRKPLITMRTRLTEQLFAEAGDIGFLCQEEAELERVLRNLSLQFDPNRYDQQVANMGLLRQRRMPAALASAYAATLPPPSSIPEGVRPAHYMPG
ncbi:MAG: hypothetical protein JOY71_01390 [Acetobacteraceae bacterium]|nr:hypothetical protein [Acetobacteraceae bacterium]